MSTPTGRHSGTSRRADANPVVGHPIIDVETVWGTKIVAAVDSGGEHNIGNRSVSLLWQHWRQHRLS